jgi:hypothetical protein
MKEIKDFPGYSITEKGEILSYRRKARLMKQNLNSSGYPSVGLMNKDGRRVTKAVHRLVAETYIENPNNLESVKIINTWLKSILEISTNEDEDFFSEYAKTYFILGDKKSAINAQKRAIEIAEKRKVEKKYLDEYKSLLETYKK